MFCLLIEDIFLTIVQISDLSSANGATAPVPPMQVPPLLLSTNRHMKLPHVEVTSDITPVHHNIDNIANSFLL